MKKLLTVAAVLALGVSVQAQTNQVLSRNAVGYARITAGATNLVLAAIPFNSFSNTIAGIFAGQLNGGITPASSDTILKWDAVNKTYVTFWKNNSGQWRQFPQVVETTNTLRPGEAFFIQNKKITNQSVFVMGEVPDSLTLATSTVALVTNLSMASYSYPVSINMTNLSITNIAKKGITPASSDKLLTFDPISRSYVTFWFPNAGSIRQFPKLVPTTNILAVAQGFFYNRLSFSTNWVEPKPYTWP